jgi:lipoprotein-anchoring transpeptidase ErfK/SrfK
MTLFEDGRSVDAYIISSGKRGMDTPKGDFQIYNQALRPWSKKYSLYMPYWQAITSDGQFGIHELPEWPGGYKEGANHLGTPVSHGCVRLGIGAAKRVFEWAAIGTPVVIY